MKFELVSIDPKSFGVSKTGLVVTNWQYLVETAHWLIKDKVNYVGDCWLVKHTHAKNPNRPSEVTNKFGTTLPYRISFILFNQFLVPNPHCRHLCNNALCINPQHLWLGDKIDNELDSRFFREGFEGLAPQSYKGIWRSDTSVADIGLQLVSETYYDELYLAVLDYGESI